MIQDCPRCGFSQPKDRYCANCGLDIKRYKPKPLPFLQRLFKDYRFSLFALFFVLSATGSYFYFTYEEYIKNQIFSFDPQPRPKYQIEEDSSEPKEIKTKAIIEELPQPPPSSKPRTLEPQKEILNKTEKIAPLKPPTQIKIQYFEASIEDMNQFFSKNEIQGQQLSAISTLEFKKTLTHKVAQGQLASLPPGASSEKMTLNQPIYFNYSFTNESGEELGLNIEITPTLISEVQSSLQIKAQLSLIVESELMTNDILDQFTIKNGQGLLVKDLLLSIPQGIKLPKSTSSKISDTPLNIFNSEEYLNQLTDFLIYIEPTP